MKPRGEVRPSHPRLMDPVTEAMVGMTADAIASRVNMRRIEFSWKDGEMARCECFEGDHFVTVFFARETDLPLSSDMLLIRHPLFEWTLRKTA